MSRIQLIGGMVFCMAGWIMACPAQAADPVIVSAQQSKDEKAQGASVCSRRLVLQQTSFMHGNKDAPPSSYSTKDALGKVFSDKRLRGIELSAAMIKAEAGPNPVDWAVRMGKENPGAQIRNLSYDLFVVRLPQAGQPQSHAEIANQIRPWREAAARLGSPTISLVVEVPADSDGKRFESAVEHLKGVHRELTSTPGPRILFENFNVTSYLQMQAFGALIQRIAQNDEGHAPGALLVTRRVQYSPLEALGDLRVGLSDNSDKLLAGVRVGVSGLVASDGVLLGDEEKMLSSLLERVSLNKSPDRDDFQVVVEFLRQERSPKQSDDAIKFFYSRMESGAVCQPSPE